MEEPLLRTRLDRWLSQNPRKAVALAIGVVIVASLVRESIDLSYRGTEDTEPTPCYDPDVPADPCDVWTPPGTSARGPSGEFREEPHPNSYPDDYDGNPSGLPDPVDRYVDPATGDLYNDPWGNDYVNGPDDVYGDGQ